MTAEAGIAPGSLAQPPTPADVELLYRLLLRREVESPAIMREALAAATTRDLIASILQSLEFGDLTLREGLLSLPWRDRRPDNAAKSSGEVLLFGAYGNGNLGDRDQAQALVRMLVAGGCDPGQIGAISWVDVAPYSCDGRVLGRTAILDYERIADAALLVIGGGGLLGIGHFPLYEERWIDNLVATGTSYVLWAIGAGREHLSDPHFTAAYRRLLAHAACVTARDAASLAAIRPYRGDVTMALDPILQNALTKAPTCTGRAEGRRVDVILKGPVDADEQLFVDAIEPLFHATSREALGVIFLEPELPEEQAVMARFPGHRVVTTGAALRAELNGARLGVSMRLHGAGAIVESGIPTVGVCAPKIGRFLALCGLRAQFFRRDYGPLLRALEQGLDDFRTARIGQATAARIVETRDRFSTIIAELVGAERSASRLTEVRLAPLPLVGGAGGGPATPAL